MNPKTGLLVAGGLGLVGVVAIAMMGGKTTTQGVTFAAPSDASVAAVESAASAEVNSVNALAVQRSQIASTTLLGLSQLQEQLNLGTLAARSTDLQTTTAGSTVALQQATSVHATDVAANVANYANMLGADVQNFGAQTTAGTAQLQSVNTLTSQNYQANVTAGSTQQASNNALTAALASIAAQIQMTNLNANAGIQEAASAGNAQTAIANNQTTQAQAAAGAQKSASFWGALGSIGAGIVSKFIPNSAPGAAGAGGNPPSALTSVTPGNLGYA